MGDAEREPCTVVLPTRNRPSMAARAARSVEAALRPNDELIVVDSASDQPLTLGSTAEDAADAAGAAAAAHADAAGAAGAAAAAHADAAGTAGAAAADAAGGHALRVLRVDRPGANRARNAGWRAARHELILFVDDDVTVDRGWADALTAALAKRPEAGFVTGRIEVPPDQVPVSYPVAIKDDPHGAVLTADTSGVLGHSASLAVRRTALEQVGGFDEVLGAGGVLPMSDETDLFDRLFAAGWTGWYEPRARAWHDQWRSRQERIHVSWLYGFGVGARIAKLRRTDPPHARALTKEVVWRRGLQDLAHDARHGYKTAVMLDVAHTAGAVAGFVRARRFSVADGHFVEPGDRRRPRR